MKKYVVQVVTFLFIVTLLCSGQDKNADVGVSKELQDKIDKSIEKGVAWLKAQQQADGSFALEGRIKDGFPGGASSIALLTLLKCGVKRDDDVIKKGFEWLKKSTLFEPADSSMTYCVSILILALEAKYNTNEVAGKGTSAQGGGNMKGEDKEWMKRLNKWLIDHKYEYEGDAVIAMDKKGGGTRSNNPIKVTNVAWGYPITGWLDNSNTQFAVLALEACSRVGITTDENIWLGITNHFLSQQDKDGEKVKRVALDTAKGTTAETEIEDRARGWTYVPSSISSNNSKLPYPATSYASMSCIGVASLVICQSELQKKSKFKMFSKNVEDGIRDGIAWLGKSFPVKDKTYMDEGCYNYALYGLERVGALAKTANIGGHLWYKEGAEDIVERQSSDGSWSATASGKEFKDFGKLPETCFCLLFLSKATFKVPGEGFQVETKR